MSVYLLQHCYKADDHEDTKIIGIYTSEKEANQAIERIVKKPGFDSHPNAFHIDVYEVNKDHWTEGFGLE